MSGCECCECFRRMAEGFETDPGADSPFYAIWTRFEWDSHIARHSVEVGT